jgi:hypothetical protein
MRTTLRVIFNLPIMTLLTVLLVLFFILEGIVMAIYFTIETPFHHILAWLEKVIRRLIKEIS